MKRYNILNMYIQGSNVSPQVSHGLNNLWKLRNFMSPEAKHLFDTWAYDHEVEINLQGGYHTALEELYENLQAIPEIPSAKFNESQEALCGACTVVTFVASERIVAINNYIRANRVSNKRIHEIKYLSYEELGIEAIKVNDSANITEEEIFVARYISRLPTVR